MATPLPPPRRSNGMATAGMICGIIGVVACWLPFIGLIAGLLGIVFGAIGMARAGRLGNAGKGAAIAGLVCGIVAFFMTGIMAAIAIPAFLDYMHKSKTSAATLQLDRLERRIKAYYYERAELPPSAAEMPGPAGSACDQRNPGYKLRVRPYADWQADDGWRALDFALDEASSYSYVWTRESRTRGELEARGDLDCDGTISITRYTFDVIEGNVRVERGVPTLD